MLKSLIFFNFKYFNLIAKILVIKYWNLIATHF